MSFSGFTDKPVAADIKNDDWWPDMTVGDFQTKYRIPAEFQAAMVADAIRNGMIWANRQLRAWRAEREASGYQYLDEVPCAELGDELELVMHYQRAVSCYAKAILMPQFKTMLRREDSKNEAIESESTEDKFSQYATQAVADFLGLGRVSAELL